MRVGMSSTGARVDRRSQLRLCCTPGYSPAYRASVQYSCGRSMHASCRAGSRPCIVPLSLSSTKGCLQATPQPKAHHPAHPCPVRRKASRASRFFLSSSSSLVPVFVNMSTSWPATDLAEHPVAYVPYRGRAPFPSFGIVQCTQPSLLLANRFEIASKGRQLAPKDSNPKPPPSPSASARATPVQSSERKRKYH